MSVRPPPTGIGRRCSWLGRERGGAFSEGKEATNGEAFGLRSRSGLFAMRCTPIRPSMDVLMVVRLSPVAARRDSRGVRLPVAWSAKAMATSALEGVGSSFRTSLRQRARGSCLVFMSSFFLVVQVGGQGRPVVVHRAPLGLEQVLQVLVSDALPINIVRDRSTHPALHAVPGAPFSAKLVFPRPTTRRPVNGRLGAAHSR